MSSLRAEPEDGHDRVHVGDERVVLQRRESLNLVPSPTPSVVRTFAESEQIERTWSRLRRVSRRVPAGLVHAAEQDASTALCGVPLSALHEFGRSRYPFERVPHEDRCHACDDAAGQPHA